MRYVFEYKGKRYIGYLRDHSCVTNKPPHEAIDSDTNIRLHDMNGQKTTLCPPLCALKVIRYE